MPGVKLRAVPAPCAPVAADDSLTAPEGSRREWAKVYPAHGAEDEDDDSEEFNSLAAARQSLPPLAGKSVSITGLSSRKVRRASRRSR